jgi:soluble lytic murein transglycosylase-like protein
MTVVVVSSLAVLFATPGWLRKLESSDFHPVGANATSVIEQQQPYPKRPAAAPAAPVVTAQDDLSHRALADFLGKRYRVSKDALEPFIRLAYTAGQKTEIDPLLILAVMAVESTFNPIAESVMGAKGLMQIIPEYHQDKLIGPRGRKLNVLDPETNILAGAKVLREYATRTGEDLVAALRLYGGTGPNASPYPEKVLSVHKRLHQFVRRSLDMRVMSSEAAGPRS